MRKRRYDEVSGEMSFGETVRAAYGLSLGLHEGKQVAEHVGVSKQSLDECLRGPAHTKKFATVAKLAGGLPHRSDRRAVLSAWLRDCLDTMSLTPPVRSRDPLRRVVELERLDEPEWALAEALEALPKAGPNLRFLLYCRSTHIYLRLDEAGGAMRQCKEIFEWGAEEERRDLQGLALAIRARALRYAGAPSSEVSAAQEMAGERLKPFKARGRVEVSAEPVAFFAQDLLESEYVRVALDAVERGRVPAESVVQIRAVAETRLRLASSRPGGNSADGAAKAAGARGHAEALLAWADVLAGNTSAAADRLGAIERDASLAHLRDALCGPVRGRLLAALGEPDAAFEHFQRLARQFRRTGHLYLSRQAEIDAARLIRF